MSRIDSHTRVIAMSTVVFATGFRNNLVEVGKICKERGIFFVVDGIQSLGALPFDVQAANVDFLAAGSQKWLIGPIGSGFLYVRHELLDVLVAGPYVSAQCGQRSELSRLQLSRCCRPPSASTSDLRTLLARMACTPASRSSRKSGSSASPSGC